MNPAARALTVAALAALGSSCAGRAVSEEALAGRGASAGDTAAQTVPVPSAAQTAPEPPAKRPAVAWAIALSPLRFRNINTSAAGAFQIYTPEGAVDEGAARAIDRTLAGRDDTAERSLNRRLLQLVFKAANHFHAREVAVVSSFRESKRKGSRHRTSEAIDFILDGVPPAALAAHLRTYARVGVGVYTHRRTQFVHLDVREQSYHWLDASPPGRTWREMRLFDRSAAARDAAYQPAQDLP